MKNLLCLELILALIMVASSGFAIENEDIKSQRWTTTDHSKHPALNKNFTNGEQITKACLSCHSDAAEQFHKTIHWSWKVPGYSKLGKAADSINNFCISANKFKDKSCNDCHPSWNGKAVDGEVNCLVCHSKSTINFDEAFANIKEFKQEGDADSLEMAKEIQQEIKEAVHGVGFSNRENCGGCHFYGGGGDGVKHGDLDSSLKNPKRTLDVHMGVDGGNFTCTRCHTTYKHRIAGRMYTVPAFSKRKSLLEDDEISRITCVSCHGMRPHFDDYKLNDHTDVVACQTCHIPHLAKEKPTKMWWDWSKAGKKKNGRPYREKGKLGKFTYMSHKGEMKWAKNVEPEYFWFNGSVYGMKTGDIIDPSKKLIWISKPNGNSSDGKSLIFPFKVHRGMMPYDTENKMILTPMLSGNKGFWKLLEWDIPFKEGARIMGVPYSGKYDFIESSYVFPSNHMVAPKEDALQCVDCHQKNGRLRNIAGVYMPGRDRNILIDYAWWILILLTLLGVLGHAVMRMLFGKKHKTCEGGHHD